MSDQQELIDIIETVYRGASKGRGLVVSPKGKLHYLSRNQRCIYGIVAYGIVANTFAFVRLLHAIQVLDDLACCVYHHGLRTGNSSRVKRVMGDQQDLNFNSYRGAQRQ